MNWSEAFAEWNAIQVAQGRQKIHLKNLTEALILKNQETNQQLNGPPLAQRFLNGFALSLARLLKALAPSGNTATGERHGSEEESGAGIQASLEASPANVRQSGSLSLVMNKLVAQLDEAQRRIEEFLHQNGELFKRMVRMVQGWQAHVMAAFALSQRLLNPMELKKLLKKASRSISSWFGLAAKTEEEIESSPPTEKTKKDLEGLAING